MLKHIVDYQRRLEQEDFYAPNEISVLYSVEKHMNPFTFQNLQIILSIFMVILFYFTGFLSIFTHFSHNSSVYSHCVLPTVFWSHEFSRGGLERSTSVRSSVIKNRVGLGFGWRDLRGGASSGRVASH